MYAGGKNEGTVCVIFHGRIDTIVFVISKTNRGSASCQPSAGIRNASLMINHPTSATAELNLNYMVVSQLLII